MKICILVRFFLYISVSMMCAACPRKSALSIYNSGNQSAAIFLRETEKEIPPLTYFDVPSGDDLFELTKDGYRKVVIRYRETVSCHYLPFLGLHGKEINEYYGSGSRDVEKLIFVPPDGLYLIRYQDSPSDCLSVSRCYSKMKALKSCGNPPSG